VRGRAAQPPRRAGPAERRGAACSAPFVADAFENEEQLLRTLVHELVHVRQIRDEGPTTDSVVLAAREREAYAEEEDWWQSYLDQR
jgi:hypothetical protein